VKGLGYKHINNNLTTYQAIFEKTSKRVKSIMEDEFSLYGFTETSDKNLSFIKIEHTNDFFTFPLNQDRDYTGGFRFEFGTDKLKIRLFSSYTDKWWLPNSRSWYSYQSLFLGGEGYTPYLRDTCTFNTPNAFDRDDRPYGSFVYIGRAKYRVFRGGQARIFSQIKIGQIGLESAENLQALLHRDISIKSVKPNGWGAQIANGGRIAMSLEIYPEVMFISKGKTISDNLQRCLTEKMNLQIPEWLNLSLIGELKIGHDMNAIGAGLAFSTANFKESGGMDIPFNNNMKKWRKYLTVNTKVQYRRVLYNSMLEGYGGIHFSPEKNQAVIDSGYTGIFRPSPDEDASSPNDEYTIGKENVERNIFIWETGLSFKLKYFGLYLRLNVMSPEFDLAVNSKTYSDCDVPNGASYDKNHNKNSWNHVGTVGLVFKID
jgi:hypothetical protein